MASEAAVAAAAAADPSAAAATHPVTVLLNEVAAASDAVAQQQVLRGIRDLITVRDATVPLAELPRLLALLQSPDASVQLAGVELAEAVVVLQQEVVSDVYQALGNVSAAPDGVSGRVLRRCVAALTSLLPLAMSVVVRRVDSPLWALVTTTVTQVAKLCGHEHDAVRSQAIRFLEVVVLLFSQPTRQGQVPQKKGGVIAFSVQDVPPDHPLLSRKKLSVTSHNYLGLLLSQSHGRNLSAGNWTVLVNSLTDITRCSEGWHDMVVPLLIQLYYSPPGKLSHSQRRSLHATLKAAYLALLRTPTTAMYRDALVEAVTSLGAQQEAHAARRYAENLDPTPAPQQWQRPRESASSISAAAAPSDNIQQAAMSLAVRGDSVPDEAIDELAQIPLTLAVELVLHNAAWWPAAAPAAVHPITSERVMLMLTDLINHVSQLQATADPRARRLVDFDVGAVMSDAAAAAVATSSAAMAAAAADRTLARPARRKKLGPVEAVALGDEALSSLRNASFRRLLDAQLDDDAAVAGVRDAMVVRLLRVFPPPCVASADGDGNGNSDGDADSVASAVLQRFQRAPQRLLPLMLHWLHHEYAMLPRGTRDDDDVAVKRETEDKPDADVVMREATAAPDVDDDEAASPSRYHQLLHALLHLLTEPLLGPRASASGGDAAVSDADNAGQDDEDDDAAAAAAAAAAADTDDGAVPQQESVVDPEAMPRLAVLLLAAPELDTAVVHRLVLLRDTPMSASAAVSVMAELLLQRPAVRPALLPAMLHTAMSQDEALRNQTLALVTEQFYSNSDLRQRVVALVLTWLREALQLNVADTVADVEVAAVDATAADTVSRNEVVRRARPFLATLARDPSLLPMLVDTFPDGQPAAQACVLDELSRVIQRIGVNDDILALLQRPDLPPPVHPLVRRILASLGDASVQAPAFVNAVFQLAERTRDASFAVPIIPCLTRDAVLRLLPSLLRLEDPTEAMTAVMASRVGANALLLELHRFSIAPADHGVTLRQIMNGTAACFANRSVFKSEVLAGVLNQLINQATIPPLLFRSIIQTLSVWPALTPWVMRHVMTELLQRRRVYRDKQLWDGFLRVCQMHPVQAAPVLLLLSKTRLKAAIDRMPELKPALVDASKQMPGVKRDVLALLGV